MASVAAAEALEGETSYCQVADLAEEVGGGALTTGWEVVEELAAYLV